MDSLEVFKAVAADPAAYAQAWKQRESRPVVGTFCSYAPEEIILASGALGYRIFGTELTISRADAHMQAYSCSLVRGALEDALDGGLDFLDGAVFPHTCDSIQRLSDIWRMNAKTGFHLDVVLPVKENHELRLRVVGRPEKRLVDLLSRLDLPLPNCPKTILNVVPKMAPR